MADRETIQRLYFEESLSLSQIADRLHISAESVRRFCMYYDIVRRSRNAVRHTPSARFWRKVTVGMHDECWQWLGAVNDKGYGRFGNTGYAHRFAYEQVHGALPRELNVSQMCRNRRCVNPQHLEAITVSEKMKRRTRHV